MCRRPWSAPAILLLVIVTVLAADRAVWGLGRYALGQSEQRFARLYAGRLDAEMALFGNSRAVHALHAPTLARTLCRPVAHLGWNGIGIATTAALARDAAARMPSLRIAVIEVSALFSRKGGASDFRSFAHESPRLAALAEARRETVLPWNRLFASAALNSDLAHRALWHLNRGDQGWINRGAGVSAAMATAFRQTPRAYTLPAADVALLAGLVADLEADGITVLLLAAPYHPVAREAPGAAAWPGRLSAALGRPVLNLIAAFDKSAFFADPLHGNLAGARALAPLLPGRLSACAERP